ncbi:MAG: type III-B CRISPR module RAMP protein Cmr4 [Syntrophobacteria bacterium]
MTQLSRILSLFAETPIHAGAGRATGAVDLPIQRERHTGWPMIQASGLKGSMRAACEERKQNAAAKITAIFGNDERGGADQAGAISVGDARLLLFPVRASIAPFVWVTCPAVLKRLKRDLLRIGFSAAWDTPDCDDGHYLGSEKSQPLLLEDLLLTYKKQVHGAIYHVLKQFIPPWPEYGAGELERTLCIISDENFGILVETATEIHTRIVLDDKTKTSQNLWYQELLSQNNILYSPLVLAEERRRADSDQAKAILPAHELWQFLVNTLGDYLQVGGDETLGRGWTRVVWLDGEEV